MAALKKLKDDGKLRLSKERLVVEIVSTAPKIYSEAVTERGVMCGFEAGGYIDKESGWAPDESLLLQTCKRGMSSHDDLAYENGWDPTDPETDFYGIVSKMGKIPESALDAAVVDEGRFVLVHLYLCLNLLALALELVLVLVLVLVPYL